MASVPYALQSAGPAAIGSGVRVQPASQIQLKRSNAIARRRISASRGTKEFIPFRLDIGNECLWRQQEAGQIERILLTPKAFAVLRYLVENAGRLVPQNELLEAVWPDTFVQPEVLKYQIADIRSALGDCAKNPRFIETLPRRGYQFIASVTESESAQPALPGLVETSPAEEDRELGGLRNSLQEVFCGERQIVFITGEQIQKTALAGASDRTFREIRKALDTLSLTVPMLLVLRVG